MLSDTGSILISGYNGPYGATAFDMVFSTDGGKILMDRTPPHPAGKNHFG